MPRRFAPRNDFFAFTLAEVLITLGVIGIVAAMTLPSMIVKYQKKQAAVQLKKAYTTLNQAIICSEADNGPLSEWSINQPILDGNDTDYAKKALEYLQPCLNGAVIKYAYNSSALLYRNKPVKNFMGVNSGGAPLSRYFMVLNDGMVISVSHINWVGIVPLFQVDINGAKGPNIFGKDVFNFMIQDKKYLTGQNYSRLTKEKILEKRCCKTCNTRGEECSVVIMEDGWEIKDYYPW